MKIKTAIALMFIAILSCNQQNVDTKAEGEKLLELSKEWSESATTGDVEKTVSYWADDAIVMSPGQPPLKGKKAIREMVEESYKIPGFRISWEPQSVEVSKSGDLAYMIEQSQITVNDSTGKAITEHYKGVSVWKKQLDGSWKNAVDISNADPSQK
jgi:uncharacterized protein (TIGR02246 family)